MTCIVAFIAAVFSPACKAMSGNSWIEICNSYGQVVTIDPATGEAIDTADNGSTASAHLMQDCCGFCLHKTAIDAGAGLYPREAMLINLGAERTQINARYLAPPHLLLSRTISARGPPATVSPA